MELDKFKDVDLVLDRANDTFIAKQVVSHGDYLGRTSTVQITNGGLVGALPGAQLVLHWKNMASGLSDDSAYTLIDAENTIFRIEYPTNMLTPGTVKANILVIYQGKTTVSREFEITVANVAGQSTGVLAKAEFSALVKVLSEANGISSRLTALESVKADKTYVDSLVSSVTNGGPKELFYSIQALKDKYPNGEIGTFLVMDASFTDGAHSYIWSNSAWTDLGVYQQSYNDAQLDVISNKFTGGVQTFYNKKYVTGATGGKVEMADHPDCVAVKLTNIPAKGKLYVPKSSLARGQFIVTTDSNDNYINNYEYGYGNGTTSNYLIYPENDNIVINLHYLNELSSAIKNLYLSFEGIAKESITTIIKKGYALTDIFKWADMDEYLAYKNWGELLDEYQPVKRKTLNATSLNGYNTSDGSIQVGSNSSLRTYYYSDIPTKGKMAIPKQKVTSSQFIIFTKDGKGVANLDADYSDGTKTIYVLQITDTQVIIDFNYIQVQYGFLGVNGFYLCTVENDSFYNKYIDIVDYNDVLSFVKLPTQTSNIQTLIPLSVPKIATDDMLIFLDNFIKDGNAYENDTLVKTAKSIAQQPIAYIDSNDSNLSFVINDATISVAIDNVDASKSGTAKILVLGESTSDNYGTMGGLYDLVDADKKLSLSYLGTRTNSGIPNEAFSGWGIGTLRYAQTANTYTNPFYNAATSQFDYEYYLTKTGQSVPDIVFINFGINDVNRFTDKTTSMTDTYDFIINQIKAKNANCKFVIGLTHSYARYGNYKDDANRQVIINRVETLQNYYKNKTDANIYLAPFYAVVDPIIDRPSKAIGSYTVGTDPVHLTADGYKRSMSSLMYTLIKKLI